MIAAAALAVAIMDQAEKDRIEGLIKRNLQTLGSPEKLVGADPKEVSRLTSRFKELAEQLAKHAITVSEPEESEEEQESGDEGEGEGEGEGDADSKAEDDAPPRTRRDVIQTALETELPEEQAARLTDLTVAKLNEHGL